MRACYVLILCIKLILDTLQWKSQSSPGQNLFLAVAFQRSLTLLLCGYNIFCDNFSREKFWKSRDPAIWLVDIEQAKILVKSCAYGNTNLLRNERFSNFCENYVILAFKLKYISLSMGT